MYLVVAQNADPKLYTTPHFSNHFDALRHAVCTAIELRGAEGEPTGFLILGPTIDGGSQELSVEVLRSDLVRHAVGLPVKGEWPGPLGTIP
jgi:hypothetical protein